MMQAAASFACRRFAAFRPFPAARQFSSNVGNVELEDMPFLHHGKRPRYRDYEKFKSPRKRASKLLHELNNEAVEKSKAANPAMWNAGFRVGDSIEVKMVTQGGTVPREGVTQDIEKVRGVVLGIMNRGLASSVIIRDVVYGLPIERKIPMHSPTVKECQVLARNFIFNGKKKVKRAKLYYFRNLNPLCTYSKCFCLASVSS
jgi:large subunit ribosomal protein L19